MPSTGMWQGEVFAISDCLVTSPPEGVARYCFHPVCLSVCVCVCVCLCVCLHRSMKPVFFS